MNIIRVGVDIAKSVFHVHGVDRHGKTQWQGKYSRQKCLDAFSRKVPAGAEIGMEACASSHHWARELQKRGYHVRLIAAQFVKPYVKSNKNDRVDAEAICEAMSRRTCDLSLQRPSLSRIFRLHIGSGNSLWGSARPRPTRYEDWWASTVLLLR